MGDLPAGRQEQARKEYLAKLSANGGPRALPVEFHSKRESQKEFKKFLRDALAEANEMMNHIAFAKSRKYINYKYADELIERYSILGKKLTKLREKWINFH